MSKSANDRNLLVGILALQLDLITQPQLIAAMQAWMLAKSNSLEVLLENQKAITQDERAFLAALVDKHLSLHNNNVEESLAALSSIDSVRKGLTALDDSDLDQTLSMVSALKGRRAWQENDDPDATTLNTGSALSGERFRILRPHARGGLGQVSVAEDRELNREVALKEIQGRYADDAESRVRFKVEAEVTGQLEHPGIVPVYSLGQTEDGRPFYVMRFIKGDSLKEAIRQLYSESFQKAPAEDRRMMLRKLLRRLVDVCNAIEYAHSRGILHRDLTPGNIMLGKYGETLVVDWGLAKHIGRTEKHEGNDEKSVVPLSGDGSSATRLGSVVGTLAFMSPEQAEGRVDELGPPSDVYCLGTTLYSILTGHNPIRRSSEFEMLQTISRGDIVPVSRANSEIDPALAAICTKAMALKQVNRYPTAAALGDDLERWLADEPVFAYKEPLLRRAGRFVRRHKTASVTALSLIAASLVAMIVISAIVTSKNRALAAANAQILNEQQLLKSTRDSFRGLAFEVLDAAEKELSNKPGMEQFRDGVMERSFDTLVQLRQDSPGDRRVALELARSARLSGNQKARTNDSPEAERRLQLSISLQEELLPTAENADDSRLYLIETFRDLAGVKRRLGKLSEAAAALETGGGLLSELTSGNNQDSNFVRAAAENSLAWIGVHYELLQQEQALESARLADEGHYAVLSAGSRRVTDVILLLLSQAWHGRMLDALNRPEEARTVFAKAIDLADRNLKKQPSSRDHQYVFSRLLHWNALGVLAADNLSDAVALQMDQALEICRELRKNHPLSEGFDYNLADALRAAALIKAKRGDAGAASGLFDEAVQNAELYAKNSKNPGKTQLLAEALRDRSAFAQSAGRTADATNDLQAALSAADTASAEVPESRLLQKLKLDLTKQQTNLTQ